MTTWWKRGRGGADDDFDDCWHLCGDPHDFTTIPCDAHGWIDATEQMPPLTIVDDTQSELVLCALDPAGLETWESPVDLGYAALFDGQPAFDDERTTHWQPRPESPTAPSAPGDAP